MDFTDNLTEWGPSIAFSFGVYVVTWIIRRMVEGFRPDVRLRPWWDKAILPILPPITGALAALAATSYPFPKFVESTSARILYGLTLGFFSAWGYRAVKLIAKKKLGVDLSKTMPYSERSVMPMPIAKAAPKSAEPKATEEEPKE
jgi:hypothetical protein